MRTLPSLRRFDRSAVTARARAMAARRMPPGTPCGPSSWPIPFPSSKPPRTQLPRSGPATHPSIAPAQVGSPLAAPPALPTPRRQWRRSLPNPSVSPPVGISPPPGRSTRQNGPCVVPWACCCPAYAACDYISTWYLSHAEGSRSQLTYKNKSRARGRREGQGMW